MRIRFQFILTICVVMGLLTACGGSGSGSDSTTLPTTSPMDPVSTTTVIEGTTTTTVVSGEVTPVSVRVDYFFNGTHSPYFVGTDQGFYADAGLEVEVKSGQGSSDTALDVLGGGSTFGAMSAEAMLRLNASAGENVLTMVAGIFQEGGLAILAECGSGIERPKDLEGRVVVAATGGPPGNWFPLVMENDDGDIDLVEINFVTATAMHQVFLEGSAEAELNTLPGAVALTSQGVDLCPIPYSDYGVNFYSIGLVARTDYIEENPDIVKAFVRATLQSQQWTFDNPEEAVAIMLASVPPGTEMQSEDVEIARVLDKAQYTHSPASEGQPLGHMATEDWVTMVELVKATSEDPPDNLARLHPEDQYTNDFLP